MNFDISVTICHHLELHWSFTAFVNIHFQLREVSHIFHLISVIKFLVKKECFTINNYISHSIYLQIEHNIFQLIYSCENVIVKTIK